jgi:chaperonin cofactor prefoldin
MSQQPRPSSRISSLEKRASTLEAAIEELSSDQAEELKAIRQEIKQLSEGITASYVSIGDTFMATWADTKATLATKDDISKLEARFDKVEGDITALKADHGAKLDTILKLLQQKSGE